MVAPFDSIASFFNPQAAAGALSGPPQPTPTNQPQQGMSPQQIAMLREYVKQLQKHNMEPAGVSSNPLLAAGAKALTSGITGYFAGEAGRAESEAMRQGAEASVPNFGAPGQSGSLGGAPTGGAPSTASAGSTPSIGDTPMERALNHVAMNETGNKWGAESAAGDFPDAFRSRSYGSLGLNTHYGSVPDGWHGWSSAQKQAYEKEYFGKIYNDVPSQLQTAQFPPAIANNPGVQAYMADRAIQMGNTGQVGAYNAARGASTPKEFMDRVTKYDMGTLPSHFRTALSERPDIYKGLQNRVLKRDQFAKAEAGGGTTPITSVAAAPIAPLAGANTAPPVPTGGAPAVPSPFDAPNQSMMTAVAGPNVPAAPAGPPPGAQGIISALSGAPGTGGAVSPLELARGISTTGSMVPPVGPEAKQTANAIAPGTVPTPASEPPLTNPQLTGSSGEPRPPAAPELSQPGGMILDKPIIPPESVPRRPMYTRDQIVKIMSTPDQYLNPVMKQQAYQNYLQQNQEIAQPYKGMGTVYINPTDPTKQRWVPDPQKFERKVGGVSTSVIQFYNPKTNQMEEVPSGAHGATGGAGTGSTIPDMIKQDIKYHSDLETAKDQAKDFVKRQTGIEQSAQQAASELSTTKTLQKVIENPNFASGLFSKEQGIASQVADKLGLSRGETASLQGLAAKLGAAGNLGEIRQLAGANVGPIRVAEMELVNKANFDPNNTKEANRAVVAIRVKALEHQIEIGNQAREYAEKHGGALDAGFNKQIAKWQEEYPMFSPEQQKNYEDLLYGPGGAGASPGVPPVIAPPTDAVNYLRAHPELKDKFEAKYGHGSSAKVLGGQ